MTLFRFATVAVFLVRASEAGDFASVRQFIRTQHILEALREVKIILQDFPQDPDVQYQAGQILRELGSMRAAQLTEFAPDSGEAHELLGRSFEAKRELDGALREYRSALFKNPSVPGIHFLIGSIYWKQRDFQSAKAELESELRINSTHQLARLRLGQTLLALNEPLLAAGHLRLVIAADTSSIEAHRELAKACRALGRTREALTEFGIVARAMPEDEMIHAQLASVYRALGDKLNTSAEMDIHRRLLTVRAEASRKQTTSAAQ